MPQADTSMGGSREAFPETAWSVFLAAREGLAPAQHAAFSRLCADYWRPVYRYVRAAWNKPVDEAKEITQGFFCDLLEDGNVLMERYRPEQGRFRAYLKAALRTYMARDYRSKLRLKAGGGKIPVSIDDVSGLERRDSIEDAKARTPDELYDRQWARELLTSALGRLKPALEAEGKADVFRVYEAFALAADGAERPSQDDVARRLGLSASQVNNYIHLAKGRLRALILERISDYAASAEDRDRELDDLFGS